MKFFIAVLIAAVTVNCLVTAINGKAATDTLAVPYTDMLLPPLEDVQADNNEDFVAEHKINATAKVTSVTATTTTSTTSTTTTTTKKPITNEVNNILPDLSIEALLPPLFEAKIEEEETKKTTTVKQTTTTTVTTTRKPITTIKRTTTTSKPLTTTTTTTTLKPTKIKVPELFLDSLLPPLLDNNIDNTKDEKQTATTQKPNASYKTTKKSYYQQQQTQHTKDQHLNDPKRQQQLKHLTATATKEVKNYSNKPTSVDKHVAESKIQTKQVTSASKQHNNKLQSKIETLTPQHVAKQVSQQRNHGSSSKYEAKQYNYNFDFILGSTTPRPAKSGLPTITPFPHRLGR